jgi:hypothetical protein
VLMPAFISYNNRIQTYYKMDLSSFLLFEIASKPVLWPSVSSLIIGLRCQHQVSKLVGVVVCLTMLSVFRQCHVNDRQMNKEWSIGGLQSCWVRAKFLPRNGHESTKGEQIYSSTISLTSAWSTPRPGRSTPEKDPVPIIQEARWL